MSDNLVELEDVSLDFASGANLVKAVQHVSCTLKSGDRIAITGPSGSGKSSLLALIAGLDQPTSGVVKWPALGLVEPRDKCEQARFATARGAGDGNAIT